MVGRAAEAARVDGLLEAARGGESGALLILGEPGIGKTALLRYARERAGDVILLRADGAESEGHLPFAGLADLLGPVTDSTGQIPPPQADALRGALGLGPPAPGDRFTTYAATLSLLAAAAEAGPLVCVVDDAHWLDPASLEAILFAGRRLGAEGIALLLAARGGVNPLLDEAVVPRMRLDGLTLDDAATLLARTAAVPPVPEVLGRVVASAAGNPLALRELAGTLTAAQLEGREPLPDPLPVGPDLAAALLRPLEALPERTRQALLVAAADGGGGGLPAALEAAGLGMEDVDPAERAGIVRSGPLRTEFSHPLVRAAVYGSAPLPDRRAAHRAHAEAVRAAGDVAGVDRRAWHLALAATGPDEEAAAELEQAAGRAMARSGYSAAAEALEAAARLSPAQADLGRRLLAAAQSAIAGGATARAARLFDEVVALDAAPEQTLGALAGRGFAEMFGGSAVRAAEMLVGASERVAPIDPAAAATLLVQATVACIVALDLDQAEQLVERADRLAGQGPPSLRAHIDAAVADVRAQRGLPWSLSPESSEEILRQSEAGDILGSLWLLGWMQCLTLDERDDDAEAGLSRAVSRARMLSTPSSLIWPLSARAEVRRRTGRLREAAADAAEAARLAEDTGQENVAAYASAVLALVLAVTGPADECRARAERALASAEASGSGTIAAQAHDALGLVAMVEGDLAGAVTCFEAVRRREARSGPMNPLVLCSRPNLAESLIREGRRDDATRAIAEIEVDPEAIWPAAAAARCRGLMASDDEFEAHFARALILHDETATPFERARTLLCLGERRRRARRVREAREALTEALALFESLGAALWGAWAERELQAAGARPRRAPQVDGGGLTPQELQVALAVAGGATNKEAAAALLISPKTIEYHLGRIYGKLGVRSRAELARRIPSP